MKCLRIILENKFESTPKCRVRKNCHNLAACPAKGGGSLACCKQGSHSLSRIFAGSEANKNTKTQKPTNINN